MNLSQVKTRLSINPKSTTYLKMEGRKMTGITLMNKLYMYNLLINIKFCKK